ncbi:S-layer protein [uncultured Methanoregula sp.]|uniref:COG1361 S-layer family protein n=1 Tax=uncultured Methanoregula sp. TaxID=1005933 RepID=UPI002AAB4D7A|nr:S-layer protein [uncultured Methanoregula sp.]
MSIFKIASFASDRATQKPVHIQTSRLLFFLFITGIALGFLITNPVSAGEQYQAGSPVLSASLAGTNEFSPGQEVKIPVTVKNTGLNEFKFVKTGIVSRDDLPNTAKFLTVSLEAGNSPFIIKSDPQMVGDLKASSTATSTFTARIPAGTPAGVYYLPVVLNYTYLYNAYQYGVDTIEYSYKTKTETLTIPVTIKPVFRTGIVSQEIQHLNAGTEGYITLVVRNTGNENAKRAIVMIARNAGSPITPTESSVYVGDFPANGTASCIFKASVAQDAEAQTYPLDVYVKYEDHNGDTVSSDIETIGIPVGKKIEFATIPDTRYIKPGEKKMIVVQYKNTGGATAYEASARISMVDPFTSNDDSAFLGDIAPGEIKTASFLVTADSTASVKEYGIDSEVRFRDALDNSVISDPIKVTLNVGTAKDAGTGLLSSPLVLGIIAVIIIAIGYVIYRKKRLQ